MSRLRTLFSLLGLLATAAVQGAPNDNGVTARQPDIDSRSAKPPPKPFKVPIINANSTDLVPNSYIVVYKTSAAKNAIDAHQKAVTAAVEKANIRSNGKTVNTTVQTIDMDDWHAMLVDKAVNVDVLKILASPGVVDYIEQNVKFQLKRRKHQQDPPAGLARITYPSIHETFDEHQDTNPYIYDSNCGRGITVFVVDSGVRLTHQEFEGRVKQYSDFPSTGDLEGHGTNVASIVAGKVCGVAKKATIVDINVSPDGSGGIETWLIMHALNWIQRKVTMDNSLKSKSLVAMALGGPHSNAANDMVNRVSGHGIPVFVPSGNENIDIVHTSPASAAQAIVVGSIDPYTDRRARDSNYGHGVIYAPGENILVAGHRYDSELYIESGTSLAMPHLAGIGACIMTSGISNPTEIYNRIVDYARRASSVTQTPTGPAWIANNGELLGN